MKIWRVSLNNLDIQRHVVYDLINYLYTGRHEKNDEICQLI